MCVYTCLHAVSCVINLKISAFSKSPEVAGKEKSLLFNLSQHLVCYDTLDCVWSRSTKCSLISILIPCCSSRWFYCPPGISGACGSRDDQETKSLQKGINDRPHRCMECSDVAALNSAQMPKSGNRRASAFSSFNIPLSASLTEAELQSST